MNIKKAKLKMKKQRITFTAIIVALGCFAFLPQMQAGGGYGGTPPDGCYPGFNTAEGCYAICLLTSGAGNTGLGWYSLYFVGGGNYNTGVGAGALVLNTADSNTAVGAAAMLLNTTGTLNTAVGTDAMVYNDSGAFNGAVGGFALYNNADGSGNNAFGDNALFTNISGSHSTAVGDLALQFSTGDYNTALGANVGTDPDIVSNNIYIGDMGFAGDTNVIAIGGIAASGTDYTTTFIGGIAGATVSTDAAVVYIDTDGHLGTVPMNANRNPATAPVRRSKGAHPQAMLNRKVAELQATVAQQQKQIETLMAQLKEQAAQIQKVSAQLELSKSAPQTVANK